MIKFLYIHPEVVYSVNNQDVVEKNKLMIGTPPTRPGIVYLSVISFKMLGEEIRKNIKSVIINLYVNEIQGSEIVPIKIGNEKSGVSKGFLLLRSSVGRYNRLDITSLINDDLEFELYVGVLENYKSIIFFEGMEGKFPLIIQIEYEEDTKLGIKKDKENVDDKDTINEIDNIYLQSKDVVYCDENAVNNSIKDVYELFSVKTHELSKDIEELKKELNDIREATINTKGITGPQGPKGDTGDVGEPGPMGPKGDKGSISSNYGYFEVAGLRRVGNFKDLRVKLKVDIIEGVDFNNRSNVIRIIKDGVYYLAYTVSITTLILGVPSVYISVNGRIKGGIAKGTGVQYQVLANNSLLKLKAGDEISLSLEGTYEMSLIEGRLSLIGINFD